MNRVDFMNQLERLLQSIAPGEREEALQYYNDYFDDAGKENEQEVIEALGNPARVAENIKRDLLGNGYGAGPVPKAQPSDRAIVEYGKEGTSGEEADAGGSAGGAADNGFAEGAGDPSNTFFGGEAFGSGTSGESLYGTGAYGAGAYGQGQAYSYQGGAEAPAKKEGMPAWGIALLVTLVIFGAPLILGLLCVLFALVICWYVVILCVGVAAVSLLIAMLALVVTGIICFAVNPWVGTALLGSGLICGGIGMLCLMLTAALGGIVTPAFWRGVGRLFGRGRRKNAMA